MTPREMRPAPAPCFYRSCPAPMKTVIDNLEAMAADLPSIGTAFADGEAPEALVSSAFKDLNPQFLGDHRIEFMCHCNHEGVKRMLAMLPMSDLKDLAENGPFPMEINCRHCATPYRFNQEDITGIMVGVKA